MIDDHNNKTRSGLYSFQLHVNEFGDLVRITEHGLWCDGQVGVITKVPVGIRGRWAILLTSGELIATLHGSSLEVINESR